MFNYIFSACRITAVSSYSIVQCVKHANSVSVQFSELFMLKLPGIWYFDYSAVFAKHWMILYLMEFSYTVAYVYIVGGFYY